MAACAAEADFGLAGVSGDGRSKHRPYTDGRISSWTVAGEAAGGSGERAEQYYQQALAMKIEFNDRYSQASTYHQLGIVAQE